MKFETTWFDLPAVALMLGIRPSGIVAFETDGSSDTDDVIMPDPVSSSDSSDSEPELSGLEPSSTSLLTSLCVSFCVNVISVTWAIAGWTMRWRTKQEQSSSMQSLRSVDGRDVIWNWENFGIMYYMTSNVMTWIRFPYYWPFERFLWNYPGWLPENFTGDK